MKNIFTSLLIISNFNCCNPTHRGQDKTNFNQELYDSLQHMVIMDQVAAGHAFPFGEYKDLSQDQWETFKDSVFRSHKTIMEKIFGIYGYPGFDLVGKDGERDFWLMVQHADFDPAFQKDVLSEMKKQVSDSNANSQNYALLTDRVMLNTGQKQIYGSQVSYNNFGQAFPVNLSDSIHVDDRREAVGLESLIDYLNRMTKMHYDMNKQNFIRAGIMKPELYRNNK